MRWQALIGGALGAAICSSAWALTGSELALRSNGAVFPGSAWGLTENGYVGTYVTLAAPGAVTVTVNALGQSLATPERMNVVINDAQMGWDVGTSAANYAHTFDLPAGTHFIRTEYANARDSQTLVVNSLNVSGATLANAHTNANALAAANTYTQNYRQGQATLHLPSLAPGTQVDVRLKSHAFNFGAAVPNSFTDTLLIRNPAPGSDAARFQQALVDSRINSLSPENAGKWSSNEATRDVLAANAVNPNGGPNIPYIDRISDFAQEHGMRYRQHNLIWGRNANGNVNQQPTWSDTMVQNPAGIDAVSGKVNSEALRDEISERIQYYIGDRAHRYYEVDVYNESYHTGSNHAHASLTYWDLYGAAGIAGIYKEAKDAVAAAGADVGLFVNEYSVLQNQGGDAYANWYVRHIEQIQNAGREAYGEDVVTGVGFQYYYGGQASSHNPARIYSAMQNMAVQGLPMHLTEWGATGGTEANAANVLEETARLVFGMPGTTGMTLWNLRNVTGVFAPVGTLYNTDWSLRQTGVRWQQLMAEWHTEATLNVALDRTIAFNGFYGDYEIVIDGQTYPLTLVKGTTDYTLAIGGPLAGDFDGDGIVDDVDLAIWTEGFGMGGATSAHGDANGDGVVDGADLLVWQQQLGLSQVVASAAAAPEPACWLLASAGAGIAARRGRRRRPCEALSKRERVSP